MAAKEDSLILFNFDLLNRPVLQENCQKPKHACV